MEPLVSVDTSRRKREEEREEGEEEGGGGGGEEAPSSDADMAERQSLPMSRSPCDAQGRPVSRRAGFTVWLS